MNHRLLGLVVVGVLSSSGVAVAQDMNGASEGFSLDRFSISERGSDWFTLESLDFRGHLRAAAGLGVEWSHKPLVIYNQDGTERSALVSQQLVNHMGASLLLWDRLRASASMPFILYQTGDAGSLKGMSFDPPASTTVGDLRLGVDARIVGGYRGGASLAAGLQVEVPTGDRENFAGDGEIRLALRAMAAGEIRKVAWAAKAGFLYRGQDTPVDGTPFGSELFIAASAGVRTVHDRLLLGAELFGSTVVTDGDAFLSRRATPLELLLGAHYRAARDWNLGVGVGPGLARAYGTPAVRVVASIEWAPPPVEKTLVPPPPPDRDGDGVLDREDACPDVPGVRTDDPKSNGCPPAPPPEPPADRDGDSIVDTEDACPDIPGVKTDDPKTHGCPPPPPDTDGDSIIDSEDACPTVPGPRDPDPKKNGCPLVRVDSGQIKILEQIKFKFNSAVILPESDKVLYGVLEIMQNRVEITHVTIQGHTDAKGKKAYNKRLSQRRARAVVQWLIKHGIAKQRLAFKGFGMEVPLDTNETEEGRANNRRVEFHIDEAVVKPKPKPKKPK